MATKLRWGVIGAGNIAHAFCKGVQHSKTGELAAVGSRSQEKADEFASKYDGMTAHGSYEALLADGTVDAVYIATPHPMHAEWAIKTAEAGKHVLCEKPASVTLAEAQAMINAAEENDVFFMEAFMYRCHPHTQKIYDLVAEKTIGEVRMIQASFGFHAGFNPDGRLFSNDLAGGGILDVGCYPVSMSRLIAGAALGRPFADPYGVKAIGHLGQTGVDEWTAAVLKFEGEIVAEVSTAVSCQLENKVRIFGSEGNITVHSPWFACGKEGGKATITVQRKGKDAEEVVVETDEWLYGIEADAVAKYLEQREAGGTGMSKADTLGNMRTLDEWRGAIGLQYEMEKKENWKHTVRGRPLKRRDDAKAKYGEVEGVGKKISKFVMGCDNQRTMPHASILFDDYFERGGNAFDTSVIYGGGIMEELLGQWVKNRGVREDVVIMGKGVHTPDCWPEKIAPQLQITLDRLQSDYVDIYCMHRDNPEVPVDEFVDALNEQVDAGRCKVFGGSNWSLDRVEQANEYAKANGTRGFSVVSNNFSLARMVDPVWKGCVHASDPASRQWLEQNQIANFAWSSQARGFFTGRPVNDRPHSGGDAELKRCWYADDNFKRRERAFELAEKKGCQAINIAAAYVLHQTFPSFALIGPRQVSETRSSFESFDVELTSDEVKWLNLEA